MSILYHFTPYFLKLDGSTALTINTEWSKMILPLLRKGRSIDKHKQRVNTMGMSLEDFKGDEQARWVVYRAAVAAGFYTDTCEDTTPDQSGEISYVGLDQYPFTITELQALDHGRTPMPTTRLSVTPASDPVTTDDFADGTWTDPSRLR